VTKSTAFQKIRTNNYSSILTLEKPLRTIQLSYVLIAYTANLQYFS